MNRLLDIANIFTPKNSYTVREERIKREGSRYYTWAVPVTATTATSVIDPNVTFPDSRKYAPLDWLEITNDDTMPLTLTLNGGDSFPIPAASMRTITGRALHHIAVTNRGLANTTLNDIIVTIRKSPMTIDKWSRKQ